jgi:hypothetical protein
MRLAAAQFGGWIVAPAAWAANTELGQILPHVECATELRLTVSFSIAAALLAIVGTLASCHAYRISVTRRTLFISALGALIGSAFTYALFLQGAATLLLNACQR